MGSYEYILWISLFAYGIHIFEENVLNWRSWATTALGLKDLSWTHFYTANTAVIIGGICAAMVGWRQPAFALILPALQLINGIGFHLMPTLIQRRFSPGLITAFFLFIPIAIWAYVGAYRDRVLTAQTFLLSLLFGALLMASPFIFLKLRQILKIPLD